MRAHSLGFLLASLPAVSATAQMLTNAPDRPPARPFTETRHGMRISDPYRWMEEPARAAELRAWLEASSAHSRAELARLPGRAEALAALQAATRAGVRYADPQSADGRLFFPAHRP